MSFTLFWDRLTPSNITSLLIYPAAFVSSMLIMLYHVLMKKYWKWAILSRSRIRAQISTASRRLQNIPSPGLLFVTPSFVAIHLCYKSHLLRHLAAHKAYPRRQFNFGRRLIRNNAWNSKEFFFIPSSHLICSEVIDCCFIAKTAWFYHQPFRHKSQYAQHWRESSELTFKVICGQRRLLQSKAHCDFPLVINYHLSCISHRVR